MELTRKDLKDRGYRLHHTSSARGYVSRKVNPDDQPAIPYEGKYGEGYTVELPRYDTTRYITVEYWIK